MNPPLTMAEARVLGVLIEKDLATPEYYPLSLNALMLGCNQKSNRDPVVEFDEEIVRDAEVSLRNRGLVSEISGVGMRVPKYAHRLGERMNLGRGEMTLLGQLLLRGPQTLAELRERASRMHRFDDSEAVAFALRRLPAGMMAELPRQAGWKETRWAQLLAGPVEVDSVESQPAIREPLTDRVARLEEELARLRADFDELRAQLN